MFTPLMRRVPTRIHRCLILCLTCMFKLGIATRLVKACDKVRDQLKAGSLTSKMAAASISDTAGAAGAAVSSSSATTSSSTSYTTYTTSSSSNTATSTTPTRAAGVSSSHQQRLTPQTRFFLG